jgi:Flp pilus assembly protein TadD
MQRSLGIVFAGIVIAVLLSVPAGAQTDGKLMGTVTAPDGEPVKDAVLVLIDPDVGRQIEFKSDKKGKYYRRGIPPAVYELRVTKEGYQEFRGDNIKIPAGGEKTVDVTMAPLVQEAPEPIQDIAYREGFEALKAGNLEEAQAKMEHVIHEDPSNWRAHYILGTIHRRKGNLELARVMLDRARDIGPDKPEMVYFELGTTAAAAKDYVSALVAFRRVVELTPDDSEAYYNIGVILLNMGQSAEAAGSLQSAIELKPDHANAHKSLGYAFLQESRYQDSVRELERYLELEPQAADRAEIESILGELKKTLPAEPG